MRRTGRRVLILPALLLALVLGAVGCGESNPGGSPGNGSQSKPRLTVGAFNFNESVILANLYAGALRKSGRATQVRKLTSREVVEPALEKGDLDVVPEYLGTLTEFLNKKANGPTAKPLASSDVRKTTAALTTLARPRGLSVLNPARAADQNAFAVTQEFATKNRLTKLSDFAHYRGRLVLGGPPECPKRPFCQPGLEQVYGLKFTGFKSLDAGGPLTKQALKQGSIDLGLVFSSDSAIDTLDLKVLDDDRGLQTADNVVPVVRTAAAQPDVVSALNGVSATLTTADLVTMNKKADVERKNPADVAADYLAQKNLG